MTKKKTKPKNNRVQYNFLLKFPTKPFTLQQLMKKYPKVQYITLYMRVKKAIKQSKLVELGVYPVEGKLGRHEKLYSAVQVVTEPSPALVEATVN